jgi:hypothetical protein
MFLNFIISCPQFLCAFAKLRKGTISSVMSVRPSVRLSVRMEHLGSQWTDFYEIWYLSIFQKSVQTIQVLLISDKNIGYFTWRPMYIYDKISVNSSWKEKYVRQKLLRKAKYIFYVQEPFSRNSSRLWDNVEEYGRAREATDDNIIWRMRFAWWITKVAFVRAHAHTQNMWYF